VVLQDDFLLMALSWKYHFGNPDITSEQVVAAARLVAHDFIVNYHKYETNMENEGQGYLEVSVSA